MTQMDLTFEDVHMNIIRHLSNNDLEPTSLLSSPKISLLHKDNNDLQENYCRLGLNLYH